MTEDPVDAWALADSWMERANQAERKLAQVQLWFTKQAGEINRYARQELAEILEAQ